MTWAGTWTVGSSTCPLLPFRANMVTGHVLVDLPGMTALATPALKVFMLVLAMPDTSTPKEGRILDEHIGVPTHLEGRYAQPPDPPGPA